MQVERKRSRRTLRAALLGSAALVATLPLHAAENRLKVDGPVTLDVDAVAGSVRVRVGEAGSVVVSTGQAGGADVGGLLESLKGLPGVAQAGGGPTVRQDGNRVSVGGGSALSTVSNYDILVPPGTTVEARSQAGRVEVSGVGGPVRVTTSAGEIRIEGARGEVRATSASGNIEVRLAELAGPCRLDSASGSIRVELPPDAAFDVAAVSTQGGVTIDHPVETRDGRRVVRGGGPLVEARSVTGSVTIR